MALNCNFLKSYNVQDNFKLRANGFNESQNFHPANYIRTTTLQTNIQWSDQAEIFIFVCKTQTSKFPRRK